MFQQDLATESSTYFWAWVDGLFDWFFEATVFAWVKCSCKVGKVCDAKFLISESLPDLLSC